jgi:hypothetical protein
MRIEPKNSFPNVSESKEEVKNRPQFGVASEVKDRFEAATKQTVRASLFDTKNLDPRSERMESVNETRARLDQSMHKRSGAELPPALERIIDAFEEIQNSETEIHVIRIRELIDKYNNGQISMDDIRRAVEEQINNSETSGTQVKSESMEFYLKVRDALEAAMRSRDAQ